MSALHARLYRTVSEAALQEPGSPESVSRLTSFLKNHPEYAEPGSQLLLNILRHPTNIIAPDKLATLPPVGTGSQIESTLEVASLALHALFATPTWPNPAILRHLRAYWAILCNWIDGLIVSCILPDAPYATTLRDPALRAVAPFLAFLVAHESMRTPDVVDPAFRLWLALDQTGSFRRALAPHPALRQALRQLTFLISGRMDAVPDARTHAAARRLQRWVAQRPAEFARATVRHMHYDNEARARAQDPLHHVTAIEGTNFALMNQMCYVEDYKLAVPSPITIRITCSTLHALATARFHPGSAQTAVLTLMACAGHLRYTSLNAQGQELMVLALKNGLLDDYVRLSPWLVYFERLNDTSNFTHIKEVGDALMDGIIPHLVYRPMLRLVTKAVESAQRYAPPATTMGMLGKSWATLVNTVNKWTDTLAAVDKVDENDFRCHKSDCPNACEEGELKQCKGCHDAFYCSRECQKWDWKHGDHRRECLKTQENKWDDHKYCSLTGADHPISDRGEFFLKALAANELVEQADLVHQLLATYRAHGPTTGPNQAQPAPLVVVDLSKWPIVPEVTEMDGEHGVGSKCTCEWGLCEESGKWAVRVCRRAGRCTVVSKMVWTPDPPASLAVVGAAEEDDAQTVVGSQLQGEGADESSEVD